MGERVLCKHEVVGSIPSGSTSSVCRPPLSPGMISLQTRVQRFCLLSDIVKSEFDIDARRKVCGRELSCA